MSLSRFILGTRVDATSYGSAVKQILTWAKGGESRFICVATVQTVMQAYDDHSFQQDINSADLVTPDGMPLVWGLRAMGVKEATRVYGPDLTLHVCRLAEVEEVPIGLYGGTPATLDLLELRLLREFPRLRVTYRHSPPFRPLLNEETGSIIREVTTAGPKILFVGIGSPKQERWIVQVRNAIPAVMLGVGAAFDFLSGTKPQAPAWVQRAGLEWLFRLFTEPRRLWRRNLRHNPRFLILFPLQVIGERLKRARALR